MTWTRLRLLTANSEDEAIGIVLREQAEMGAIAPVTNTFAVEATREALEKLLSEMP